jgi:UDP-glucose 4-epimerase
MQNILSYRKCIPYPLLADGNVTALKNIDKATFQTPKIINLGTDKGYSVMEIISSFEQAS